VIVVRNVATEAARIDDVRVIRAHCNVTAFSTTNGVPIGSGDCGVIGSARYTEGIDILLRAIETIRDLIIGSDVIELRSWLIVL
jgi:hypothetical protein